MASLVWQQSTLLASHSLQNAAAAPLCAANPRCTFSSILHQRPQRSSSWVVRAADEPAPVAKSPPKPSPKPTFSMSKGQIVRVDKEKYLNSVNYLSVGHPPYFKGLDYIYEDRGEVLDIRIFDTGEYALIAWAGIPTSPAWLPTDMLIKSAKLSYKRT